MKRDSIWRNHREIAQQISAQVQAWEQRREARVEEECAVRPFITISREFGAMGLELGRDLASSLSKEEASPIPWITYDQEILQQVSEDHDLPLRVLEALCDRRRNEFLEWSNHFFMGAPSQLEVFRKMASTIRSLAAHGNVILIGRGSNVLTGGMAGGLHVRVVAPRKWRIEKLLKWRGLSRPEAEELVETMERKRDDFVRSYLKGDVSDATAYDLVLNNARFSLPEMIEIVTRALKVKTRVRLASSASQ